MNNDNLRKALEANRFYYARMNELTRPEYEHICLQKNQIFAAFYSEMTEIEVCLQAVEAKFGYKYDQNQPRVPAGNGRISGQWGGNSEGVTAADRKNPRFKGMTDTQIKKQKFVDAHLAVTEAAAKQLNVPVANILGVSALESKWGLGDFVLDGPTVAESTNSYFGMHAPAPFMNGTTQAARSSALMAGYANYQDSLRSFTARYGNSIKDVSDPLQFANIIQQQGKFGIDPDTGKDVLTYTQNLVSVIHHLSGAISYARNHP